MEVKVEVELVIAASVYRHAARVYRPRRGIIGLVVAARVYRLRRAHTTGLEQHRGVLRHLKGRDA